eukprot:TRINITY_DN24560_c0_g1_i1.p1 TRINITY_DN24560_c0_g1~~TRINITY_DN24560_c0_g1_i1.p1  ORF type:complete len:172 (+),score=43.93 TRINITY_DN24560_c0_g1_i1:51-518(+)
MSISITVRIELKGASEVCAISADQTAGQLLEQVLGEDGQDYEVLYAGNPVGANTTLSGLGIMDGEEVEVVIGKRMSAKLYLKQEGFEVTGAEFIQAVESGKISYVQKFIDAGIPVDFVGEHNLTALLVASINGNAEILEILLQNGADVSQYHKLN